MKFSKSFFQILLIIIVAFVYIKFKIIPNKANNEVVENRLSAQVERATTTTSTIVKPCDPTKTKCGMIRLVKNTIPDSYQDFTFFHNIPGYQPITLDDDSTLLNPSTNIQNLKTMYTPYSGVFTITETSAFGYATQATCTNMQTGAIQTVPGQSITVTIGNNARNFICIFSNKKIEVEDPVTQVCPANTWAQKPDFGGVNRYGAIGFSVGNKGYLGAGRNSNVTTYNDFWEYNPQTNVWTQKADIPGGGRGEAISFSIGTKGYVGTGKTGVNINLQDFYEYNPQTNVWTQKADFAGGARSQAVGFSVETKGYVGTGMGLSLYNDFWEYNPQTDTWTQKANFGGGARRLATGFSVGSNGYLGTGRNNGAATYSDFWEYNPQTDTWTQKADFGGGQRHSAVSFGISNKGYIGTGYAGINTFQDFYEYNPQTNIWTQKADLIGQFRSLAVGFSIENKGYIGTGNAAFILKDFYEYCPG